MVHPVANVTEEQAAAAGLDPDKEPYVLVFLLRRSDEAGPAGEVLGCNLVSPYVLYCFAPLG